MLRSLQITAQKIARFSGLMLGYAVLSAYWCLIKPLFLFGGCKHHPSCSIYALNMLQHFGLRKGGLKALKRLLSCW